LKNVNFNSFYAIKQTFKIDEKDVLIEGEDIVFSTNGVLSISKTFFSIKFEISLLLETGGLNKISSVFLRFILSL